MVTKIQLGTRLDQRLGMSQQLKQAIQLLQYSTLELTQVVKQQAESNPLLELSEESEETLESESEDSLDIQYTAQASASRATSIDNNDVMYENYSIKENLRQHLFQQTLLCHFDPKEQAIAEIIINSIEDNGRLVANIDELQRMLEPDVIASPEEIENVLKIVQTFEPLGVAARSINECLLIQLENMNLKDDVWDLAKSILINSLDIGSSSAQIKKWLQRNNRSTEDYTKAVALIRTLHIDPGLEYSNNEDSIIEPELRVKKVGNKWIVNLIDRLFSKLRLNRHYQMLIKENNKDKKFATLREKLKEAKWFLNGLSRRNDTLLKVGEYIMQYQLEFLEKGPAYIKPMNIIDVSSRINMHESTVSRVTNGKYIATPWGMFELKHFLPSHLEKKDGGICSSLSVKELIKKIVGEEDSDHILSDDDIASQLKGIGIKIARRTIAKYREALNILPSYQRAQIKFHQE